MEPAAFLAWIDRTIAHYLKHYKGPLSPPLARYPLSVRAERVVERLGLETVDDLARVSELAILAAKNTGEKTLAELAALLWETSGKRIGEDMPHRGTLDTEED